MALSQELLHILNDKDEPLPKRLKIADNAFKSLELPLQRKEAFLLKWLSRATKSNEKDTWELLLNWLRSPQVLGLSRNDITYDDLQNLLNVIVKGYKHEEHSAIITSCVLEIVQNKTFQLFFKHDVLSYCTFVKSVLLKIKLRDQLHKFLYNKQLFHRHLTCTEGFHFHFLKNVLPTLAIVASRFPDPQTFAHLSKLINKCIFQRHFIVFSEYFKYILGADSPEHVLPKDTFGLLSEHPELCTLVFDAFCNSYDNFGMIYSCFVVLLQILGFKMDEFFKSERLIVSFVATNKSIAVLTELSAVLCTRTCDLSLKLNEKSFAEAVEYVLVDVLSTAGVETYEFLNKIIQLHPMVLNTHLDEVLVFVLGDRSCVEQHETFLLGLFEVFAKLHRVARLIGSMVNTVKVGKFADTVIIPKGVLTYFTQCITTLGSWPVLKLFESFLVQLDDAVACLGSDENCTYVEFVSMLLCQFLMSVRIAEHTVPTAIVESFMEIMANLKDILKKFGRTLVRLEHNPRLMQTYLNLCLKWGDLHIILIYYSNNTLTPQKSSDTDFSATNIIYLHSYLTGEQWGLISQRIANFGEKPCKQIMQNLCVQKVKAMYLFEDSVNPEVVAPVVANILSSIDDQDEELLFNNFVLHSLLLPGCTESTAEVFVKTIRESHDIEKLQKIGDSLDAVGKVLYVFLHRMNKTLGKQNRNQSLTAKVLKMLNSDLQELTDLNREVSGSVNEAELNTYLDFLKTIHVAQFQNTCLIEEIFLYMVALQADVKHCVLEDDSVLEKCENLVVGIAQSLKLSERVVNTGTIALIVGNFAKYDEVFNFCMQSLLRDRQKGSFYDVLDMVLENLQLERYMRCATIFLDYVEKFKSSKLPEDLKRYRGKLCEKLFGLVQTGDGSRTEAFAFVLKMYLLKNGDELQKLLSYLECYLDLIANSDKHIKGSLLLLSVVIKNSAKCQITSPAIMKIWTGLHRLKINKEQYHFTKLVGLTLPHVGEEDFRSSSSNLLSSAEAGTFKDQLNIWIAISSCTLTNAHTKTWLTTLEQLMYRKIFPNLKRHPEVFEDLVRLQLAFLQNAKLPLSAPLLESVLMTVSLIATADTEAFVKSFSLSMSLLDSLIKNRKTQVSDYLPVYLQRYRTLLNHLCTNSNSDLKLNSDNVQELADCAHNFEKLTKSLVGYDRALMRICPYVMADIFKEFEKITIYPNVKIHLNNCLYQLLSLCDDHGVSFLKRMLSTASTEMFKVIYENYNKYYKFTGKV